MKSWLKSKTLWLNILGALVAIIQAAQGQAWMSPEWQVFILAVLNALVRLVTNTSIAGTPGAKD